MVGTSAPNHSDCGKNIITDTDIRIILIIFETDIIFGRVVLDQTVFQRERFHFRIGENIRKIVHREYHAPCFFVVIGNALKIL